MKNVLFVGVNPNFISERVIQAVFDEVSINKAVLLVHEKEDAYIFEKYGKCFFRADVAQGIYKKESIDMSACKPLDDMVFSYMTPYVFEILNQQRRFEEYHAFHISGTYEEHYMIYMHNLFFWNNLLESENITHVFFSSLPHEGYDSIIYHLSKMKNIPVKMIYNSTLPRRYYVLSDFMNPEENIEELYQQYLEKYNDSDEVPLVEEAEKLYEKWTSLEPEKMRPWYMKGDPLRKRFEIRFGGTNVFKEWETAIGNIYVKYNYKMCWKFVKDCINNIPDFLIAGVRTYKRWLYARPVWKRTMALNQFYETISEFPVKEEQYIYFALHYQPEASSNPLGGREYADQMFAIHLLARSIPEGMYVYVKVHPEQLAPLRSREYYEDMKRIPNVRLIKTECSTYELIKGAFAVSSLTGTVCWEAQFFGVPAIVFGYSHKNLAPLSHHVRTYQQCKDAIRKISESERKIPKKQLRILLKAMFEQSFSVSEAEVVLPKIIIDFLIN